MSHDQMVPPADEKADRPPEVLDEPPIIERPEVTEGRYSARPRAGREIRLAPSDQTWRRTAAGVNRSLTSRSYQQPGGCWSHLSTVESRPIGREGGFAAANRGSRAQRPAAVRRGQASANGAKCQRDKVTQMPSW